MTPGEWLIAALIYGHMGRYERDHSRRTDALVCYLIMLGCLAMAWWGYKA